MTGDLPAPELAALAAHLAEHGVRLNGELRAELLSGGRSNLTYRLRDDEHSWVFRRPPRAGATPSAHDVVREHRVVSALAPTGFPVARPVLVCAEPTVIGAPFSVVEFVPGTCLRSRVDLAAVDDAALGLLVDRLVGTLAELHGIDHVAVGLQTFGRPDGYAARQVRRWAGQWDIVGRQGLDQAATLLRWLRENLPPQRRTAVVHGDYRIDNTLLNLAAGTVEAVVDWELSTIGDPVADVAMMCAYRHPALDLVQGLEAAWTSDRLPDPDRLAARYEAAGGVRLEHWEFHLALAFFKLAVIAAGIEHRWRAGATPGEGYVSAGESVREFLAAGLLTAAPANR